MRPEEACHSPSSPEEDLPRRRTIEGHQALTCVDEHISDDHFTNRKRMRCIQSAPASLTVCLEVRPHHQALRQPHTPGPSRSTMAFFLSWKASSPDLRKQPFCCLGGLPLHPCPWAKGFRFPQTQPLGMVPESSFSSAGQSQGLREEAPDTRLTLLSLSSPEQGRVVQYLIKRC